MQTNLVNNGRNGHAKRIITPASGSLTEVEIFSRNELEFGWGDGHMEWFDAPWMDEFEERLPQFEREAAKLTDREAELAYVNDFMSFFGQHAGIGPNFKVLPNASLSIDVVMRLASRRQWKVQLVDPCFDNLFLYGRESGLSLTPLLEGHLQSCGAAAIDPECQLVFLVSPNNPTGVTIDERLLRDIASRCARERITLAIDASFRAYDMSATDHYQVLLDEGCSWVVIEDTGKTFPTRERKVSVLSCSNDLKRDLNEIAEIHVLGWSTPVLLMLRYLIAKFSAVGLEAALHAPLRRRRTIIQQALRGTFVRSASSKSSLPVEWLEILDDRFNDEEIARRLSSKGLGVLPGWHFHWSTQPAVHRFFRISLMKRGETFQHGVSLLRDAILSIG